MELQKDFIIIFITFVGGLRYVEGQCSEAHRQACSYSYLQLQSLSSSTSTTYVPDYNETTLRHVCRLYEEYRNCSASFLPTCNKQTIADLQTYDITLGLICHELLTDYIVNRNCYQRLSSSHDACKVKELEVIHQIDSTKSNYMYLLCSSSKEYALCIYTVTALGCSMPAADIYFKLLNHTISSIFYLSNYQCILRHPLDEISIYTTSPSTTTDTLHTPSDHTDVKDSPKHSTVISDSCIMQPFNIAQLCISIFVIYIFFKEIHSDII